MQYILYEGTKFIAAITTTVPKRTEYIYTNNITRFDTFLNRTKNGVYQKSCPQNAPRKRLRCPHRPGRRPYAVLIKFDTREVSAHHFALAHTFTMVAARRDTLRHLLRRSSTTQRREARTTRAHGDTRASAAAAAWPTPFHEDSARRSCAGANTALCLSKVVQFHR